jgi:glycosyltransferase involved in cell wall biosynthesis
MDLRMADRPLVSVITATYNRAHLVAMTLDSVVSQDYRPIEMIVVDDASTDDTVAVVERSRSDFEQAGIPLNVRVRATNGGPASAFNEGLEVGGGSLVSVLGSDDLWHRGFLPTMVDLLSRYPDCGVAFSGVEIIDEAGTVLHLHDPEIDDPSPEGVLRRPLDQLITRSPFRTSGTLIRRSVFDAVGTFDECVRFGEDTDLWYRLARDTDFAYTRIPLIAYRIHPGMLSSTLSPTSKFWSDKLTITLRQAGSVRGTRAKAALAERVQEAQLLLQEQLLREGRRDPALESLLENAFTPSSPRFRLGRRLLRAPRHVGRCYAHGVRMLGKLRRDVRRRG